MCPKTTVTKLATIKRHTCSSTLHQYIGAKSYTVKNIRTNVNLLGEKNQVRDQ